MRMLIVKKSIQLINNINNNYYYYYYYYHHHHQLINQICLIINLMIFLTKLYNAHFEFILT